MDFMDPGLLFAGGAVSMIGMGVFIYGKRMQHVASLGIGLSMMVYPMFVQSFLWILLIGAACIATLYGLSRMQ
jgi:hypothetical protein